MNSSTSKLGLTNGQANESHFGPGGYYLDYQLSLLLSVTGVEACVVGLNYRTTGNYRGCSGVSVRLA